MDIEKSFTYSFEDKDWLTKLGIGAAIGLIPILNFAWSGYMVAIIRNVMDNKAELLPTWDDLGKKFMDGLILFAAGLIYALPIFILVCLPLSVLAFSGILAGTRDMEDIARAVAGAGGVLFFGILCVVLLYGLVLSILHPAILILFSREGTFASCFKVGEAFGMISRNAAPFFTAWGLSLVAGLGVGVVIGFLNLIVGWIPCIGWIVSMALSLLSGVYLVTVYAHLFGQFGREVFRQNLLTAVG